MTIGDIERDYGPVQVVKKLDTYDQHKATRAFGSDKESEVKSPWLRVSEWGISGEAIQKIKDKIIKTSKRPPLAKLWIKL